MAGLLIASASYEPERKASIAWAIIIPTLRIMNVLAKAEYIGRLLQYEG